MDIHQLAALRLHTGYVFENGSPFYEKLGDERAAALLKALQTEGYRIVAERNRFKTTATAAKRDTLRNERRRNGAR
jgi:hypothetical protein